MTRLQFTRSLTFRMVSLMLLTAITGIIIVAVIIHQATRSNFDVQRTNWQALAEQNPSVIQAQLLAQYEESGMRGACQVLDKLDANLLTIDVVLTDNNQTVHCASKPRFNFAQVVFHGSGVVRLFSDSDEVMAYDLAVAESLPLKNTSGDIEGWAMSVEAKPLMLAGSEFAWRIWQQSGIWVGFTLILIALFAAWAINRIMRPIAVITKASERLRLGDIPSPLANHGNTTELTALTDTFNRATQALTETEKLRQQLVSDIAHELRTPVTNIKGQLEALQLRLITDNDEFHHTVANEVMLLQQLISDFQDLAQTDSGQICLNLNSFPLLDLMEDCLLSQKRQGITISINIPHTVSVRTDELRFRQIMLNLLENARRAKPEQLHVEVSAIEQGNEVVITFCDNGPGIDESDVPHIFDRFYRAEKSRNRNSGGSGLGLAIVKGLLLRMHGDIRYQSAEPCGASFIITLPCGTAIKEGADT
ncbi:sensor histidine kinase [Planctobacterium marinum]|uniref:Signal transduction histidine-protein kinase/phosphatase MprB n=1 Tax=Planctobacterium marinum TaxID=1631968 RepID=A0AA48HJI0_9ALTE|nr:hypothetical protein MACH26_35390 [Planctobacterium marinum]